VDDRWPELRGQAKVNLGPGITTTPFPHRHGISTQPVGNVLIFDAVGAIQVNVRSIAGARAVLAPAASESSTVASVSLETGFSCRRHATS
jgi:hypothetical protein